MIMLKTQKKFYKAKLIIGMIGIFAVAVIVCMCGQIQQHWNCQTVPMVGSVLYLMENWQQCIQAAAQKMETIIQVDSFSYTNCFSINLFMMCGLRFIFIQPKKSKTICTICGYGFKFLLRIYFFFFFFIIIIFINCFYKLMVTVKSKKKNITKYETLC